MQAGTEIAEHRAEGRIAVHCLRGSIRLQLPSEAQECAKTSARARSQTEHHVRAIEGSVLLLTMVLPR
jgi:quercetin dioxygenase-like cupin family protein